MVRVVSVRDREWTDGTTRNVRLVQESADAPVSRESRRMCCAPIRMQLAVGIYGSINCRLWWQASATVRERGTTTPRASCSSCPTGSGSQKNIFTLFDAQATQDKIMRRLRDQLPHDMGKVTGS